jgi:hypothetical protein
MATTTQTGMAGSATRTGGAAAGGMSRTGGSMAEAQRHSEGAIARGIEDYTAQLPSDTFLWAAGASIAVSLGLMCGGNRHAALFVGQWAPTILLLGLYNKVVKVAGSDRVHAG